MATSGPQCDQAVEFNIYWKNTTNPDAPVFQTDWRNINVYDSSAAEIARVGFAVFVIFRDSAGNVVNCCGDGFTFDPMTQKCQPSCGFCEVWDPINYKCVPMTPQDCGPNATWDPTTCACVPNPIPETCPAGWVWDPQLEQCVLQGSGGGGGGDELGLCCDAIVAALGGIMLALQNLQPAGGGPPRSARSPRFSPRSILTSAGLAAAAAGRRSI